nr:Gfo/Idh/MocA family oxidoreductase [Marinicella sp. W31]MDC2879096.1 Gfo/Idh/MocA family oxidoreductase [Marinicella sp. W31]
MAPYPFVIVGTGWRAQFFLRVAAALPERFQVLGVVSTRTADERAAFSTQWNVPVFNSTDALLKATHPAFAVLSVPREETLNRISEFAAADIPILTETPPAADHDGLLKVHALVEQGARIEVAEQYFLHPVLTAMRNLIAEGRIGTPSYAHISIIQTYHGVSLMRKLLGIGFENATISANRIALPMVKGPGRYEQPDRYEIIPSEQMIGTFDFGDRIGIYDFAESQHRSRIREPRVTVRGERGEITPERTDYLIDERTPISVPLLRKDTGHFMNFEGYSHVGIMVGERWIYRNPFAGPHLTDDEIAVATCLANMHTFVETGQSSYSFAEAAQDCYLADMMAKAAEGRAPVATKSQPWARSAS